MKIHYLILIVIGSLLLPGQSLAKEKPLPLATVESQLIEHGQYTNKRGATVHSPAHSVTGAIPTGASAQCRDESYSFSQSRQGTCSRHSGVAHWLN